MEEVVRVAQRTRPNKRDLIVHQASRLFYERGTGLGVDTLIDEIGVAKMTLYKHFGTKDELIVECLHHIASRYRDHLRQGLSADSSATDQVLGIFDSLREWFIRPSFRGCAFVNATVELSDPAHPAHEAVMRHKASTREWVTELVARCDVTDPQLVARQIVQLMEGTIITAFLEHDPTAADVARVSAAQVLAASGRHD
ncbi:TetR/AcrR family transcriptional regulator [Janibacter sp. GS2]|uniref:TetR/AcrR family transcriptional regulator n=1 Tax=Janibacter sp. GS2 TaxID=3442646 RepID=UPI003EBB28D0